MPSHVTNTTETLFYVFSEQLLVANPDNMMHLYIGSIGVLKWASLTLLLNSLADYVSHVSMAALLLNPQSIRLAGTKEDDVGASTFYSSVELRGAESRL